MRVLVFGLCCGVLLSISAIADERLEDAWFSSLDHKSDGGISFNELKAVRNEKFYLIDINRDKVISPQEVSESGTWSKHFIHLDTNANGLVELVEFETMALTVFSLFDINADGQITAHNNLKFQHKNMNRASTKKVFR